ncbi:histone H1 [Mucilaginibacter sp. cycad4]|uniref:histone H1 n=1 Tax=Mucilaginibacter sp. cycad4 TaxID=3342096 RepID=UPI002AAB2289|nr:histone H1 [Mucilaginibacter gossypii]WPV02158.1 histone H1 [Mucilaginibacter gossypii]
MEKIAKLKELVASAETDATKFYERGNSAAGTRLRKTLQEIKVAAQDIRQDVTNKKKS